MSLICLSLLALSSVIHAVPFSESRPGKRSLEDLSTCHSIAQAISSASRVYYPASIRYAQDISHWASSSTQLATCSVEPGTAADIGIVLQILGSTRTPFAVKGGGHTSNPGFSSTTGVHISMTRFNEVTYNSATGTATIGAGLIWDDVYAALEPHAVNVVGGRVSGVGVAGFTLGGGYSWLTNQYGLTIDTVESYELVLPNGTATIVTGANEDLFFGLKGGFNNFGIVTKFTLKTFPQTQVWGGIILFTGNRIPEVLAATEKFSNQVTDAKAAIIVSLNTLAALPGVTLQLFYDGPTPPSGIFEDFLAIPAFSTDISTRSFLSLVTSAPAGATSGLRASFHTVSTTAYTTELLNAIVNETVHLGQSFQTLVSSGIFLSYAIEPFHPDMFSHGPATPSAYPPTRAQALLPMNIYFGWTLPLSDQLFQDAVRSSAAAIHNAAIALGQDISDAPLYGNYAIYDTPLERIYGANLPRLRSIKANVDPNNVMGLAGGWKL